MAQIREFKGIRPRKDLADKVAELPYDVLNSQEARTIAAGNEFSFFHISKPEIDLDEQINPYDEAVYRKGKENLERFIQKGVLAQDNRPCLYLYTQIMNGRAQTGLVASVNIDDYLNNRVKKHELTRADKEQDRTTHLDILNANTGPVFLLYHEDGKKESLFKKALEITPEYDFTAPDGISHILRVIDDPELIRSFGESFKNDILYIADGHHRAASAVRVGQLRRKANPSYTGDEEFNWFLAVIFPHNQLKILPYNRVIRDFNGMNQDEFIAAIEKKYTVTASGLKEPDRIHSFSFYCSKQWYTLVPKFDIPDDPIEGLDVKILQNTVLDPLLGIKDPRTDKRIDFIGGIRGTGELEKLVDSGNFIAAFSMYPTTVEQLINVSESDGIMPPKSTWFEPKLRSGMVVHLM
ncbi:MAG TPA: DUF1015 family protein [Spirochaetota bacterium]|nr:DUF1015 family protein [Spirochaetota bacterium]HPI89772.1 DUF1015 family protein [Spirochaetota bacterium]HPR47601.1 DUF1015 family protein [Spirochaetota bacterium]